MKKYLAFILPIFLISLVRAEDCGITNLASCIAQNFFEFLVSILNAPIQPLLDATYNLLTQPVNTSLFFDVWGIIVYILSMFYGLILLYTGFKFVLSGHSPIEREKAKRLLTNTIIMMVLVQASYSLYSLIIDLNSSIATTLFNLVQQNFFLVTIDNLSNIGLSLMLLLPYIISILITLVILTLRYVIVSSGVILFALGIFFYFIEPLNDWGKLIINFLISSIAITIFYAIIFLASAKLLDVGAFADIKIIVMTGAFSFINIVTIVVVGFALIKSALRIASPIVQIVSLVQRFV